MKRTLLLLSAVFYVSLIYAQYIPNGGFENWSNDTIGEDLDEWTTTNSTWFGTDCVTRSTDCVCGNYSVKMETKLMGQDTIFGFVLHGDAGEEGPAGGIPYTDQVNTINGWYKYDIMPDDTAIILVQLKSGGDTLSEDLISITGTQDTWTEFMFSINAGLETPDTVFVGFVSSNALEDIAVPGSWLMVDSVYFTTPSGDATPLPNNDFENWHDITMEDVDDWNTMNPLTAGWDIYTVRKTTDCHSGTYAAEMETYATDEDTVDAIMTLGTFDEYGIHGGVPFTDIPEYMEGYYKYYPSGTDTARIIYIFTNGGEYLPNGMYGVEITAEVDSFVYFQAPVLITSAPDTVNIVVFSGNNPGSLLILDDLEFTYPSNISQQESLSNLNIYPNPATDKLFVSYYLDNAADVTSSVTDIQGREVINKLYGSKAKGNNFITLDISSLSSGLYIYRLIANDQVITRKFAIK